MLGRATINCRLEQNVGRSAQDAQGGVPTQPPSPTFCVLGLAPAPSCLSPRYTTTASAAPTVILNDQAARESRSIISTVNPSISRAVSPTTNHHGHSYIHPHHRARLPMDRCPSRRPDQPCCSPWQRPTAHRRPR